MNRVVNDIGNRRRARGQGGYLLMASLAILGFFTITLVAVLGMTMTATMTTADRVQHAESLRLGDAAIELVLNTRRLDRAHASTATVAGDPCPGATTVGTVTDAYKQAVKRADGGTEDVAVQCVPGAPSTDGREFVLHSFVRGDLVGTAAIRIDDRLGPGEGLLICDWQLGANAAEAPATCP